MIFRVHGQKYIFSMYNFIGLSLRINPVFSLLVSLFKISFVTHSKNFWGFFFVLAFEKENQENFLIDWNPSGYFFVKQNQDL